MNIHLMTPLGFTGYGYVGLNILDTLSDSHNVALSPIGPAQPESAQQVEKINKAIESVHLIPTGSPALKIWHQFDLLTRPGNGKYFTLPFFEVDTFNDKEKFHLNFVDEIIVTCSWAKKVIQNAGIDKPIHIVPMGVDTQIFAPTAVQPPDQKYVFLNIGKWEKRKAHDTIIHCFNKAFNESDNVELWMATSNPFLTPEEEKTWLDLVDQSKLRDKIKVFPRLPNHEAVAELMSYSHCGIYISRGEGWNMELLETMSMGKPVIASNYSAHTQYCTEDNSFLVDMPDTEPAVDNKFFFGQSNWGKIGKDQIDQTINHMRYCFDNKIVSNPSGIETAKNLSWKNCCHQLIGCIS